MFSFHKKILASLVISLALVSCGQSDEDSDTSSLVGPIDSSGNPACANISLITLGSADFRCFTLLSFIKNSDQAFRKRHAKRFDTLFTIDPQFPPAQREILAKALFHLEDTLLKNMQQLRRGLVPDFVRCSVAATNREHTPRRYVGPAKDIAGQAQEMLDSFFFIMENHSVTGKPLRIKFLNQGANKGLVLGRGNLGFHVGAMGSSQPGDIEINSVALLSFSETVIAGTIFHELMHNVGWTHDQKSGLDDGADGTRGTLIKEAGNCIRAAAPVQPLGLVSNPKVRVVIE